MARGEVAAVEPESDAGRPFLLAAVRLDGWPEMHVVSLRLAPQPVRFDFWSADSWRTYANIRRKHRQELAMILHHLEAFPGDAPLVIAGDFNAPAGDAIFELLRPKYADAFAESGRGWGCTLPNRFPLLRIDQVWTAGQIEPLATCTAVSQTSDHRLLIADLQLRSR
ncbi:MAG: endonuclease/exonuclease/phosphatase family protein [Planctomycetaceae bacterium]|nr:endonuclease/exonuclease/phosphatase family protein [Planctomycetaceae bacterium]